MVSSYDQVFRIGSALAHNFFTQRNTHKIVLNIADAFATNNNCGFNLANFKPHFIRDYYSEVVSDYERSYVGSIATALFEKYLPGSNYELYFTIVKFENNLGYSLTQNQQDEGFLR